jgi:hypothetical protein
MYVTSIKFGKTELNFWRGGCLGVNGAVTGAVKRCIACNVPASPYLM